MANENAVFDLTQPGLAPLLQFLSTFAMWQVIGTPHEMNRSILNIALPAIVANITVPLLGLIDIGISGHLGRTEYIGAIAVGAMMFNLVYWNFGFLRMGTAGLTAQAYGKRDTREQARTLAMAVMLAAVVAIAILVFQYPLQWIALELIQPSGEVADFARSYFFMCVWGAPAILISMAIKGWFIGMQDSRSPMLISIGVNLVNIMASMVAVFVLEMGFSGIPVGTVIAEYSGLAYALFLIARKHRGIVSCLSLKDLTKPVGIGRFFNVNKDIFLRSTCLMAVTLFFVSAGARSGDITLAVNALMMQLFTLFSYFMDGFAYAGEALVGRYVGERSEAKLRKCVRHLFGWGAGMAIVFATAYATCDELIFKIITDDMTVIAAAMDYHWWCMAIPVAAVAGFVWDGIYIGLTATRQMLHTIMLSCATFFVVFYTFPDAMGNDKLWLAFISYLAMRGVSQAVVYRWRLSRRIFTRIKGTP